jgi:predicted transcriptional regulator
MQVKLTMMRTTVEITDEQRSRLLAIAASRGMKGFSTVVQEALEVYLASQETKKKQIEAALALKGSLDANDGQTLEDNCTAIRNNWR